MDLQFGDLVGFSYKSRLKSWINGLSHVGMIGPGHMIYESIPPIQRPCVITGKRIRGIQAHDPGSRIRSYSGHVYRYRLNVNLNKIQSTVLGRYLEQQVGALGLYDAEYLAAALDSACIWSPKNASRWTPNRLARALVNMKVHCPPDIVALF